MIPAEPPQRLALDPKGYFILFPVMANFFITMGVQGEFRPLGCAPQQDGTRFRQRFQVIQLPDHRPEQALQLLGNAR